MTNTGLDAYLWMHNRAHWLAIGKLIDGALYIIQARNSHLGVWHAEHFAFIIAREKISRLYLFEEFHWDIGEVFPDKTSYGTAKPFILLDTMQNKPDDLLQFLLKREEELPLLAAYEMVRALDG